MACRPLMLEFGSNSDGLRHVTQEREISEKSSFYDFRIQHIYSS